MEQILNLEGRKKWFSLIENARKVLCVGHVNPDGDALGSTLMLMKWLQRKGKEAHVVMPNHYPDFLAAVPGASEIVTYDVNPGTEWMLWPLLSMSSVTVTRSYPCS